MGISSGGVRGRKRMEDIGSSSKRGVGCVVDVDRAITLFDVVVVEEEDELLLP